MFDVYDAIGDIGVVCFLLAYFLMQKGRIVFTDGYYLGLNLAGSVLIIISLWVHWNLPAFILEAAWGLISLYGMYIHIVRPKLSRRSAPD
jgi:hypothetical protein